jgi:hypothetical protein
MRSSSPSFGRSLESGVLPRDSVGIAGLIAATILTATPVAGPEPVQAFFTHVLWQGETWAVRVQDMVGLVSFAALAPLVYFISR